MSANSLRAGDYYAGGVGLETAAALGERCTTCLSDNMLVITVEEGNERMGSVEPVKAELSEGRETGIRSLGQDRPWSIVMERLGKTCVQRIVPVFE